MDNPISDLTDEFGEQLKDTGKTFVREVVKGIPKTAKQQLSNKNDTSNDSDKSDESNKSDKSDKRGAAKTDPVTGKPVPSPRVLSDLTKAMAQLSSARLKQIREQLEKQRLKVSEEKGKLSPVEATKKQGVGPAVPAEGMESEKTPKPEAVTNTLKGSKSTGEFKGLVGG